MIPSQKRRDRISPSENREWEASLKKMKKVRTVPTTPYSVFVHSSAMYLTSELPIRLRQGRPGPRVSGRQSRMVSMIADEYPYANRRWSDAVRSGRPNRGTI